MSKINIPELAQEIKSIILPETQQQIMDLIESINGQALNPSEILERIVAPLIGISNESNRKFTSELIQRVVNLLDEQK